LAEKLMNNMPEDDVWELVDLDPQSQHYKRTFSLDFCAFPDGPIEEAVKEYVWRNYREKRRSVNGLRHFFHTMKHFLYFAKANELTDLRNLDNSHVDLFRSHLSTAYRHRRSYAKGKGYLSRASQRQAFAALKALVKWGQVYRPHAFPKREIFSGNEFPGINKTGEVDVFDDKEKRQIEQALKTEENVLVKAALIILRDTGIRPGDLLGLKTDCLQKHAVTGDTTIVWWEHKKKRWTTPLPAAKSTRGAVKSLLAETERLRKEIPEEFSSYLFIGDGQRLSETKFRSLLKVFVERHDLRGSDNEDLRILPRKFRRTLATDMLSDNKSPEVVRQVLGHDHFNTTSKYYASYRDKSHRAAFRGFVVGDLDSLDPSIVTSHEERAWFDANKNAKARMEDGYCTKPYRGDEHICEHLKEKRNCYGCNRFVTTPEYLPFFRDYLDSLKSDAERYAGLGNHYVDHFLPTMKIINDIVGQLESIISAT
jgi:integrase